jgi:hypothetical protein
VVSISPPITGAIWLVLPQARFRRSKKRTQFNKDRRRDTLQRFLFSSRVAGALGLIAVRFLPPAGLNHIKAQALGTLDGEAVYFARSMRWFSGTRVCWTRMLPDRSEGLPARRISGSAPCRKSSAAVMRRSLRREITVGKRRGVQRLPGWSRTRASGSAGCWVA